MPMVIVHIIGRTIQKMDSNYTQVKSPVCPIQKAFGYRTGPVTKWSKHVQ